MSKAGKTKTADTPQVLLEHHLKALRLPTFLGEYEKQARECATAGVDHARYLLRLAELELIEPSAGWWIAASGRPSSRR